MNRTASARFIAPAVILLLTCTAATVGGIASIVVAFATALTAALWRANPTLL